VAGLDPMQALATGSYWEAKEGKLAAVLIYEKAFGRDYDQQFPAIIISRVCFSSLNDTSGN
jgi:hypothetical protein